MENIYCQFWRYIVPLVDSFERMVALYSFQVSCADNSATSRNKKSYARGFVLDTRTTWVRDQTVRNP